MEEVLILTAHYDLDTGVVKFGDSDTK